jgi:hypothetical protein
MVRALFVSACLFMVVGCGSGTSHHGASNPAQEDCFFYVENELCPALLQCGALNYSSVNDCINYFEYSGATLLDCGTVTVEYGGLSSCEAQTNNSYCDELVDAFGNATLPNVCLSVFN